MSWAGLTAAQALVSAAIAASLIGLVLGLFAAAIAVRDEFEGFRADSNLRSRYTAWAAFFGCLAVLCLAAAQLA